MAPEMGKLTEAWTTAKKQYEAATKKKKPGDKTLFWTRATGIEPALKKVDANYKGAWTSQAKYNTYNTAYVAFNTLQNAYWDKLKDIGLEAKEDRGVPAGLTEEVYGTAESKLGSSLTEINSVARKYGMQCNTALSMSKSLAATVKRGQEYAASIKKEPTPVKFNYGIQKAARDITQQIDNIDRLAAQGMDTGYKTPENLVTILSAWGNKGRKVKDNATTAEVLRENGAFEQAVLGVKKWLDAGGK